MSSRDKDGPIDVLSQSFADDFTRLLNASSKMHSTDGGSAFGGHHRSSRQSKVEIAALYSKTAHLAKFPSSHSNVEHFNDDNTGPYQRDTAQGPHQRRVSSASKKINMDISMNEIKEVDEGQITQRRLRKRIKAIEMNRKQNQRVKKLQKYNALLAKARSRDLQLYKQSKKGFSEDTLGEVVADFEREDFEAQDSNPVSGQSHGRSKRNPSITSFNNNKSPTRPAKIKGEKSSSFNPRQNPDAVKQMQEGMGRIRRLQTGYQKQAKTSFDDKPQPINMVQSVPNEGIRNSLTKQTPHWGRSKVDQLSVSNMSVGPFEGHPTVTIEEDDGENKTIEMAVPNIQDNFMASENMSDEDIDMFSENKQLLRLTADERKQIEHLKTLKSGQQIDPSEWKGNLLQAPFSPQLYDSSDSRSNNSSKLRHEESQGQWDGVKGRWLIPGQDQAKHKMWASNSEVKLECAREQRLREGFKRRIIMDKNLDLFGGADDSDRDNQMLESKLIKSLGPKLHGVVLQLPPQTSFDFKDQLRRPASAKLRQKVQVQRTQFAFEKAQRQMELDKQQEAIKKTYQSTQYKELDLSLFSWAMPFKMKMQFADKGKDSKADDKTSTVGSTTGKDGKTKKATKTKKGKGKGKQEEKKLTKEEEAVQILEEIAQKRREQAIANLYPEPDSKIFLGTRTKSASRSRRSNRRNIMPTSSQQTVYNKKLVNKNNELENSLRLKLDQLQHQSAISINGSVRSIHKGKGVKSPLNSDLMMPNYDPISEAVSSQSSSRANTVKSKSMLTNQKKGASFVTSNAAASRQISSKKNMERNKTMKGKEMNADLPMMRVPTQSTGKSKFKRQETGRKTSVHTASVRAINSKKSIDLDEENKVALNLLEHKHEQLKQMSTMKRTKAIEAIQKGSQQQIIENQKFCQTHKKFGCICQQIRERRASFILAKKGVIRFEERTKSALKKKLPRNLDFKRTWEQGPSRLSKMDHTLYVRDPPMPEWKMILGYEDEIVKQLRLKAQIKLYSVKDVQEELEELTEDEDEIENLPGISDEQKDVWQIKRKIKVHIKQHNGHTPKTDLNMYKIGRILGKGAYGKVNIAMHKLSKKLCAVKSINMDKMRANLSKEQLSQVITRIAAEEKILTQLRHPNIVKLYEVFNHTAMRFEYKKEYKLMFMEICTGGNMLAYLRRRRRLEENIAQIFMKQLITALGYLHHENVVHRDIKLENILLSNLGELKLCDFGVSVLNQNTEGESSIKDCSGTPAYMAPEVIAIGEILKEVSNLKKAGKKREAKKESEKIVPYGPECDVWSAGVVLYALIYGQLPFRGVTVREIKNKVKKGFLNLKEFASDEVRDLIRKMIEPNQKERITIEDILQHDWLIDIPNQTPPDVSIFDESERAIIIKEYFVSEDWEKWEKFIYINATVYSDYFKFQESNLETENDEDVSDESIDPNMSERSEILAPNNSDENEKDEDAEDQENEHNNEDAFDKYEKIDFCKQALIADDEYEREHDENCDNGVYREGVDLQELALKTGLKQNSVPWNQRMQSIRDEASAVANSRRKQLIHAESFLSKKGNQKPVDLDFIDENIDWTVGEIQNMSNPYSAPQVIRGDLIFKVSRFGYRSDDILKSVINNTPNYQAATYYLLGKDHERIC